MQLATLCYLRHNSRTLMLYRNKKKDDIHSGKWNGLGGKFNSGETPEECVIREVCEESGLVIKTPLLRGFITFPSFNNDEDWYVFVFTATDFTGSPQESAEGHLEWIDDSNLSSLNLWPGDKLFLKWIQAGRFFSAKFVYHNEELVEHSEIFYDNPAGGQQ
jgi:8-oxo-dGTP diphosphatase